MKIKKIIVLSLISSLLMTSCTTRRDTGVILGTVLGGTSGYMLGKNKKDKRRYGLIGAVAGAMIGASIGDYLDELDQVALSRKAIALANNNQRRSTWRSDHSGATAELVVVNDYIERVYSEPIVMEEPEYEPITNNNLGRRVLSFSEPRRVRRRVATNSQYNRTNRVHSNGRYSYSKSRRDNRKIRTYSESRPRVSNYSKEKKVLVQRKCKDVNIIVRLPNGERKTDIVKTCQDKNGIYGV